VVRGHSVRQNFDSRADGLRAEMRRVAAAAPHPQCVPAADQRKQICRPLGRRVCLSTHNNQRAGQENPSRPGLDRAVRPIAQPKYTEFWPDPNRAGQRAVRALWQSYQVEIGPKISSRKIGELSLLPLASPLYEALEFQV